MEIPARARDTMHLIGSADLQSVMPRCMMQYFSSCETQLALVSMTDPKPLPKVEPGPPPKAPEFDAAKESGRCVSNMDRAPLMSVGDVTFGQSHSINRYVAQQNGFMGSDMVRVPLTSLSYAYPMSCNICSIFSAARILGEISKPDVVFSHVVFTYCGCTLHCAFRANFSDMSFWPAVICSVHRLSV